MSPMEHEQGHDRLAWRLTQILIRLNTGESLDPEDLAQEYGVNRRTIQRDLNERFAFLPLEREQGRYRIDPAYLGRLQWRDLERFAQLAGVSGLFPALDSAFIRELFDARIEDTLSIHGVSREVLSPQTQKLFRNLQQAIGASRCVQFAYRKDGSEKQVTVAPYRLMNHDGIWYLAAVDQDRPKAYALTRIAGLIVQDATYTPDASIHAMLDSEDSIWLNSKKTEVVLTIAAPVAHYFKRRKLIARQTLVKELEDGGLIVSGVFAHLNQILPTVRQWIPHVRIVSPEAWQDELEDGLVKYLNMKSRKNHE